MNQSCKYETTCMKYIFKTGIPYGLGINIANLKFNALSSPLSPYMSDGLRDEDAV